MNNIQDFIKIITELQKSNIINDITSLSNKYLLLEENYNKLENDNKVLQDKLKICNDQYSDLNKVSYVRSLSIELQNKNNYIKQLEQQLEKYKINKQLDNKQLDNKQLDNKQLDNKEQEFKLYKFNINDFEENNEYELIKYKNNYYLKKILNNDIYNILNNKPYTLVGSINDKGKVKLI